MLTKDAIIEKYPNGQIEWRIPIEWYVVGRYRMHGEAIQYYPTGEVKLRRTYEHGNEVGDELILYKDGSVMSKLPFDNGQKHGTHVFNHKDGSREEADYDQGVLKEIRKYDTVGKEKKKDAQSGPAAGPKKILPGDHVPSSIR